MAFAFNDDRSKADIKSLLGGTVVNRSLSSQASLPLTIHPGDLAILYNDIASSVLVMGVKNASSGISDLVYIGGWKLAAASAPNYQRIACTFCNMGSSDITISSSSDLASAYVDYIKF